MAKRDEAQSEDRKEAIVKFSQMEPKVSDWRGFERFQCPWVDPDTSEECQFDNLDKAAVLGHMETMHPTDAPPVTTTTTEQVEAKVRRPSNLAEESNRPAANDTKASDTKASDTKEADKTESKG